MLPGDSEVLRKQRGAFFTPMTIAQFLADWALRGSGSEPVVLDPTCGEGVFLLAAARAMSATSHGDVPQLIGVDLHHASLDETRQLLDRAQVPVEAALHPGDFFDEPSPGTPNARIPFVDAVVGNPPFVRFQNHSGETRRKATALALAQGVRLTGLASSWAALLVHASSFLKPEGRIAMVLPAELLSVGYAEPIRRWLRNRFKSVHIVLFDRLQFEDADAQVVLLVAKGRGGCSAFSLHEVSDASELEDLHIFDAEAFTPQNEGKWTDLLVPEPARGALRRLATQEFVSLNDHGATELGTVTGANKYFTLPEIARVGHSLTEGEHVVRTVPAGSRHVRGTHFTVEDWEKLRNQGERVWLLSPRLDRDSSSSLDQYILLGERLGINGGYKCSKRETWWRLTVQPPPDYFFTYMSHVAPRLIANEARSTFLNSMHGVYLHEGASETTREALPLLALNTITLLSAEVLGRSYGGGILKMEPREAATMPLPSAAQIAEAWPVLAARRHELDSLIHSRRFEDVTRVVDEALLGGVIGIGGDEMLSLENALARMRQRRQGRSATDKRSWSA